MNTEEPKPMTQAPSPAERLEYTPTEVAWALAAYEYNASPVKRAEALFPGRHPDYLEEWAERFAQGYAHAVSKMDPFTLERYVALALEAHGEQARHVVTATKRYFDEQRESK